MVKSVRTADTPSRLEGADNEIGKWIRVDHEAGYFVPYRIAAWRFESSLDSPEHSESLLRDADESSVAVISINSERISRNIGGINYFSSLK